MEFKCVPELNNLVGFIGSEKNQYTINFDENRIIIGGKSIDFSNKFKEEFGTRYLEASILLEAFGVNITFNPRSLTAKLKSRFEIPFIKKLRLQRMRNNINKLQKKEVIVDTIIRRDYHLFEFGTLDWELNSAQNTKGNVNSAIRLNIGTELFYGAANFTANYTPKEQISIKDIGVNWRWVNNDNKYISQARIGRVGRQNNNNNNSNTNNLIGATINNSPNTVRRAGGSYTITDNTEPNWNVELYINDVLIDYVAADAYGLYVFKVPIIYGYNTLKLKFYGPLGEERTEERVINTPYTFAEAKTITYSLTAAVSPNNYKEYFSSVNFNYGVTRNLTMSGGLQYSSNTTKANFFPFMKVAYQPLSIMVLTFDYLHNKSLASIMNLNITKNAFLSVNYLRVIEKQSNKLAQLNVGFSMPFASKYFSGFTGISWNRDIYELFNYDQIRFRASGYFKKLRVNSSSFVNWTSENTPQISTSLALSYNFKNNLSVITEGAYDAALNKLKTIGARLQLKISEINLSANYGRNFTSTKNNYSLNMSYNLPFSRLNISNSYDEEVLNTSQAASGSMTINSRNGVLHTGNNSAIGKAGLLLYPFLDLNENGTFDSGEEKVLISSVKISGAKAVISKRDSIVRVFDLNSFVNHTVEFSDTNLNNIAWRFKHKTYKILTDPNQYKKVYIPVISVGELSGMVYLTLDSKKRGQGRVNIQIFDKKGKKVTETLSEFDGYFSYLGLKPGKYTVRVDPEQLKKLNYKTLLTAQEIVIKVDRYGDIVDNISFNISEIKPIIPLELIK